MHAADIEALMRRIVRDELRPLCALIERMQPAQLSPQQAELVRLLSSVFGRETFTTRELIRRLEVPIGDRPTLRATLAALAGAELRPNKVGLVLRGIVESGGRVEQLRLVGVSTEGGARVWGVEGG